MMIFRPVTPVTVTYLVVERSKVNFTDNQPYLQNGKYELQTWYTAGVR